MGEFVVTEKRRIIWEAELQIFDEFDKICKKYNLRYFFIAGSLLGAIRHNGFIPWDDDIDIAMFREDYEKFLKIAKQELPPFLFLQNCSTETDYFYGHAKIRDSRTTAIRKTDWYSNVHFNQGIFIDLFPLDSIPDNKWNKNVHCLLSTIMHRMVKRYTYYKGYERHTFKMKIIYFLSKFVFCFITPTNMYLKYERFVQKYNGMNTAMVGLLSEYYNRKNLQWLRSDFNDIMQHLFEDRIVSIPSNYINILKKSFGDWKAPRQDLDSIHGSTFFDANHPYTDYINGSKRLTFIENL